MTNEIMSRGLARFQVTYFKECLEGDEVGVHVWQEGDQEEVLCCMVCQVKLFYFNHEDDDDVAIV